MAYPPTAAPDSPRGARLALALLLGINLFNYLDRQVLAAVVTHIRDAFFGEGKPADGGWAIAVVQTLQDWFGFEPKNALIGSLQLAFMTAYMVLAPVFGWLAERTNRWWIVGGAVAVWSLASGASGLATSFGMLFLTRCLVGTGEAAYGPVAPAIISDLFPVARRGQVLAWFYMAIPVGSALGYVLGGAMSDHFGWPWAFFVVVPPGLLLALCCFLMREPQRGASDPAAVGAGRAPGLDQYRVLLRTPSYIYCTLGMTAMTFAMGGIGFWMPDYIHHFRGQPNLGQVTFTFGVIVVVAGFAATLAGGWAGDKLRDRYPGSYFLVSGGAMLVGFPVAVAMLYVPFPWAWGVIFLACFCLFFNTGPANTILANVTHPSIRAGAFALNIFVIHAFGDAVSPLLIGLIADKSDMTTAFLFVAFMILLSGVLWLWGAKYLQRDTELAPTRLG
jgi:MFS family permease